MLPVSEANAMRMFVILNLLCVIGLGAVAREVKLIDLRGQDLRSMSVKAVAGTMNGGGVGGDGIRSPQTLSLAIAARTLRSEGCEYDIKLTNIGAKPISIPTGTDMRQLYSGSELTNSQFDTLSFYLTRSTQTNDNEFVPQSTVELFGRKGNPSSFTNIPPGSWITVKARVAVNCGSGHGTIALRCHSVLSEHSYRDGVNGLVDVSTQLETFESNKTEF